MNPDRINYCDCFFSGSFLKKKLIIDDVFLFFKQKKKKKNFLSIIDQ